MLNLKNTGAALVLLLPILAWAEPSMAPFPVTPRLSMPAAFDGHWASAVDVANAHKVCRQQYQGDDAATVHIDAMGNLMQVQFYENTAQLRWLSLKDKSAQQVRGVLQTATRYEGDDADTVYNEPAQMVLQAGGRQILTKNVLQRNTTRILVRCGA